MIASPGETIRLRYTSPLRNSSLFPTVRVLDSASGDIIKTVELSANANISYVYENTYTTLGQEGTYHLVYTAYTAGFGDTPSTLELDIDERLEVQTIAKMQPTVMGGGITENDLDDIAKRVVDLLRPELSKEINFPTQKETDLTPVLKAIEKKDFVFPDFEQEKVDLKPLAKQLASLKKEIVEVAKKMSQAIKGIKFPVQEKVDLSSVLKAIASIKFPEMIPTDLSPVLNSIEAIDIPVPIPTDLTPITQGIEELQTLMLTEFTVSGVNQEDMKKRIESLINLLEEQKELIFKMDDLNKKRHEISLAIS